MKAKNIQEYLGSLQQTVVTSWRKHLKSSKHDEHVILNDFYDDMLDAVDELTEAYMAHNGKVEGYVNLFKDTKKMSAYDYVKTIHDFTDENRDIVGDESELQSLVDDVLSVCDTAMYKLKELVGESQMIDLVDFIKESMEVDESSIVNDMEVGQIIKGGGYFYKKINNNSFQELSWDPVHKRPVELKGLPRKTARQVEIDLSYFDDTALYESVEEPITEARLSPEAKWVVSNTIDQLQKMDNTIKDNDYKSITIEPREDDSKYNVYYKGDFMMDLDVFPADTIDADAVYNIIKELKWLKK